MIRMKAFGLALSSALLVFVLTGCFGEEYVGNATPPVVVVSGDNPCSADASLCLTRAALLDTGEVAFQNCSGCHGEKGEGSHGPPLQSDFLMNNRQRVINLVLRGNQEAAGPYIDTLSINGIVRAGGGMPAWASDLTNAQIAGILTYLRSELMDSLVTSCGGDPVTCTREARTPAAMLADTVAVWEVKAVRDSLIAKSVLNPDGTEKE